MAKYFNYAMIMVGLALLFEMAGLPVAHEMLKALGLETLFTRGGVLAIKGSTIWVAAAGITVIAGMLIGAFTRTSPENYIVWPIILLTIPIFSAPLIGIYKVAANYPDWIFVPTAFIMGLLSVGFMVSIWETFRGRD